MGDETGVFAWPSRSRRFGVEKAYGESTRLALGAVTLVGRGGSCGLVGGSQGGAGQLLDQCDQRPWQTQPLSVVCQSLSLFLV